MTLLVETGVHLLAARFLARVMKETVRRKEKKQISRYTQTSQKKLSDP